MSGPLRRSSVCSSQERPARLQINAAARPLTGSRMKAHITDVLKSLHWPLVNFRIDFKFLLPVLGSLNGFPPKSISNRLGRFLSNGTRWSSNAGIPAVSIPRLVWPSRQCRQFTRISVYSHLLYQYFIFPLIYAHVFLFYF